MSASLNSFEKSIAHFSENSDFTNYALTKSDKGLVMSKQSGGKIDPNDMKKNLASLIYATISCVNNKEKHDYKKIISVIKSFTKQNKIELELKELEKISDDFNMNASDVTKQFSNKITKIASSEVEIESKAKSIKKELDALVKDFDFANSNINKQISNQGKKALENVIDVLISKENTYATSCTLKNYAHKMNEIFVNKDNSIERRIETSSISTKHHEEEERRTVIDEASKMQQNPWQHCTHFLQALRDYSEYTTPARYNSLCNDLKEVYRLDFSQAIHQLQQPSNVTTKIEVEPHELQKGENKYVTDDELVQEWVEFFPDYDAVFNTFAREEVDALYFNGTPLSKEDLENVLRSKGMKASVESLHNRPLKIACLAEALLLRAKKDFPTASAEELKKAIGESLSCLAIDYNPTSRPPFLLSAISKIEPSTPGLEILSSTKRPKSVPPFSITLSASKNTVQSTVEVNTPYKFMNSDQQESKTILYTSVLSRNFTHPETNWKGLLSSHELLL
jgi:hypothetical protein